MKLLFTLLSFCMLFACTITKRHFGAGYHIEWKRNHSTEKKMSHPNNDILSENEFLSDEELSKESSAERKEAWDSIVPDISKESNDEVIVQGEKTFETSTIQLNKQKQLKELIDREKVIEDRITIEEEPRKVEKFTWVTLTFLALGASLLMVLSLIGFYSNPFGIVLIILGSLAMAFSIVSVVRIRKKPDRYKAKWLTWMLLGLSTIGIGALLFMIIYYLLLITNNVDLL